MKVKVSILLCLISMLLLLYIFSKNPREQQVAKQPEEKEEVQVNYKTFEYVITDKQGNHYYGQSLDGKTKISFNVENVKLPIEDEIMVHDKIMAYLESENHVDGIFKIEKIE